MGTIFASLTITEDESEIATIIEQLMVAIFTNPVYEFDYRERNAIGDGLLFFDGDDLGDP